MQIQLERPSIIEKNKKQNRLKMTGPRYLFDTHNKSKF